MSALPPLVIVLFTSSMTVWSTVLLVAAAFFVSAAVVAEFVSTNNNGYRTPTIRWTTALPGNYTGPITSDGSDRLFTMFPLFPPDGKAYSAAACIDANSGSIVWTLALGTYNSDTSFSAPFYYREEKNRSTSDAAEKSGDDEGFALICFSTLFNTTKQFDLPGGVLCLNPVSGAVVWGANVSFR